MVKKIPVVAIIGPTAVGKTEFSLALAARLNAEVISVDSRQVYRYLDVGTDKVSREIRREVIHHLIDALFLDLLAAVRAMRNADSRIQQTEIVINLCYCSDSRTRVTVRRFLINRNRRRKSFDLFHIRLLHLS